MSAILKDDFATQAGHFYAPDGSPRYTIIGKNGKERNTTVRDAREHGLLPSVTTILRQAAAPGLEKWKIGNAIMSALTLARQEGESDEDYINRIVRDSNEQAAKARDKGTEIHGAIEKYYGPRPYTDSEPLFAFAESAAFAVAEWSGGPRFWDSERSFASPLGFGGKLDLSAPGFVLDFKTTDKDLTGLKLWPDHRRQLAAYRHGLNMPEARCSICYVSSTKPEARVIELDEAELKQGWTEFKALLAFYYAMNKLELP
jgi:hypothetical protein